MASRLLICFGAPHSGLGLYRSLINQLPFVTDQTAELEGYCCNKHDKGNVAQRRSIDLDKWLSELVTSPGLHLLVSSSPYRQQELWQSALRAVPNLMVHSVCLVRHPWEIADRESVDETPVQRILDWCKSIAAADVFPNCHLSSFDELLTDPLASISSWFQTIPDNRLMRALHDPKISDNVLLGCQPAKRTRFAVESVLVGNYRFKAFSGLYSYLQAQRLYQPEQLRGMLRLLISLFSSERADDLEILRQAKLCVQSDDAGIQISAPRSVDGTLLELNLVRSVEQLQAKQATQEALLKIAEDARKGKQLTAAALIYRFLLLIDSQSLAALTGYALTLNDMKQWGDALSFWDAIFTALDRDGVNPSIAQRNGRNASTKQQFNDIGYVLRRPVGGVTVLREHIVQNPGAHGHVALMRAWKYLDARSNDQAGALLVNDTRTQINIGCYTTTNELLRGFADAGMDIDYTITLKELSLLAGVLFGPDSLKPDASFPLFLHRFASRPEFHAYRKLIAQHKSLIVNGEGSLYDQQRKGLILCIFIVYAKQYCGSQVYFINHSADLRDLLMRRWIYRAYQNCDYIAVREHISRTHLPEEFSCFDIRLVPDAAYRVVQRNEGQQGDCFHGLDQLFSRPITQPYVVVSGTSAIFRGDREGFFASDVLAFNNLLRAMQDRGFQVVLLASDNTDYKLLRQAAIELDLPLVSPTASIDSVLALFRVATAFISGRWHSSIIAACAGCPSILGDANFFKTTALHEFNRYPWPMFDFRNLINDEAKILLAIQNCQNEKIRKQVLDCAYESESQVAKMINEIVDDFRRLTI